MVKINQVLKTKKLRISSNIREVFLPHALVEQINGTYIFNQCIQ